MDSIGEFYVFDHGGHEPNPNDFGAAVVIILIAFILIVIGYH